ncbi:MAG: isochorismatase family cysteine hydrolase [Candidatus Acidiferrales bacterium]
MPSRKIVFWEVDAQEDFMLPGGSLYVPGAEKIIPKIKRLVDAAREGRVFLVSSACRHLQNDPEFKLFPPHCIRGTQGARIIPEGLARTFYSIPNDEKYKLPKDLLNYQQVVIEKQTLNVFDNPQTSVLVDRLGKDAEFIVFGVVTELCVCRAVKGLLDRGHKVSVVKDAIETLKAEDGRRALAELTALGAELITTADALAAVNANSQKSARG